MKRIVLTNRFMKNPENAVRVMRPSKYGNPYKLSEYSREESLRLYEIWLDEKLKENPDFLESIRGKDLICSCPIELDCHANRLIKRCNG